PGLHPRGVLLPGVARGVRRSHRRRWTVAAGRSDAQSVSCRRDAPPAHARWPRTAGGHPPADRSSVDQRGAGGAGARQHADPRWPPAGRSRVDRDSDSAAAGVALCLPPRSAIHDLAYRYGHFAAVDGVSLEVQPGEIHGFLGANGAGKTTTLRMIAGLLKPTAGRVTVNGHDMAEAPELAKGSLGFIPDRPFIYEKLTAGEF